METEMVMETEKWSWKQKGGNTLRRLKVVGEREKLRKTFRLLASVTVGMCSVTAGDEETWSKIS